MPSGGTLTGTSILLPGAGDQYLSLPTAFSYKLYQLTSWTVAAWVNLKSISMGRYLWAFGTSESQ